MKHLPLDKIHVTSPFGMRLHPIQKVNKLHTGVDLSAATGTKVYAVDSGTVICSKYIAGCGETIVIKHNGYYSAYYHLSKRNVTVNNVVQSGFVIALSGNTGDSTGPHLHFGLAKTFNLSAFSKSNWYDPMEDIEVLQMTTTPMKIKIDGKLMTVEDNIVVKEKNYTGVRALLEALGYKVGWKDGIVTAERVAK